MNYKLMRNLYYAGIAVLVLNALPQIPLLEDYSRPLLAYLAYQLIGMPLISIIALATGFGAFMAYKFRKIG